MASIAVEKRFEQNGAGKVQGNQIRVLLVDDDSVDADLTARALSKVGNPTYQLTRADSLAEAEQRLLETNFDVALLDLGLPDTLRSETVSRFREASSGSLPVVILTGLADDRSALDSLDLGAQDYLSKDEATPELLSRSIRYAVQRHQLHGQLKSANDELEKKNERLAKLYNTAQEFVENVSHEFRTPLTVIREFSSIICDGLDGPVTPKQVDHLQKILHRTDDLALMVDDMLDISKLEAGLLGVWRRPTTVVELLETVRGFLDGRAKSKRIVLGVAAGGDLPQIYCDEEKARRVLINLAVNAIKFTPESGSVELWANANDDAHQVTVGVTDTGPGISPHNLSSIFDRFRQVDTGLQASVKGFGLGLNIAKELVALNLGQIDVTSEVGAGTTFSFTLPMNNPHAVFVHYLKRIQAKGLSECALSLLTVGTSPHIESASFPVVDEFLQRSLRADDLVVRFGAGPWVVIAPCQSQHCVHIIRRLNNDWAQFERNCPQNELPKLVIKPLDTWSIPKQYEGLSRAYMGITSGSSNDVPPKRKVLVVDDDREVSQCLCVRLQSAGYDVVSAMDGEAGLAAAIEHHPDAVVLDVRMPKKDGLTVLREIRADCQLQRTPIVMLSASVRDQHRALEAGASYFVPKPYEAKQVLTAIESSILDRGD
jgi:signal transduction histidine kinase